MRQQVDSIIDVLQTPRDEAVQLAPKTPQQPKQAAALECIYAALPLPPFYEYLLSARVRTQLAMLARVLLVVGASQRRVVVVCQEARFNALSSRVEATLVNGHLGDVGVELVALVRLRPCAHLIIGASCRCSRAANWRSRCSPTSTRASARRACAATCATTRDAWTRSWSQSQLATSRPL